MTGQTSRVFTAGFPDSYAGVREALRFVPGVSRDAVNSMHDAIYSQRDTLQGTAKWSDPDKWIGELLSGADAHLARRLWNETRGEGEINPRYVKGLISFLINQELLDVDASGVYRRTERGRRFLKDDPATVRAIDQEEGILRLLSMLATMRRAKREDLLPEWQDFLRTHTNLQAPGSATKSLYSRLRNLVKRGLVHREGRIFYLTTQAGIDYVSGSRAR